MEIFSFSHLTLMQYTGGGIIPEDPDPQGKKVRRMNRLELRARSIYPEISHSEQLAAEYFVKNQEHIFQHPLSVLAKLSGTSQGAWVRFCKSMGYSGMKELKKAFFDEINRVTDEDGITQRPFLDVQDFSSIEEIAEVVGSSCMEAIRMTRRLFDAQTMERAADAIIHASSVRLYGVGASGTVAADLYQKLLRMGYHVNYSPDFHVAFTYLITASRQDVAVLVSNSGETPEILTAADLLRKGGATVIGITKHMPNSLIAKCDYVLYMDSPEVVDRSGAVSSRVAQMLLTDILFITIANRDYARISVNLSRGNSVMKAAAEKRRRSRTPPAPVE